MRRKSASASESKIQVPERALIQRINRALALRGEKILRSRPLRGKTFRGKPVYPPVGRFYRVSAKERAILARDVDLVAVAHELELLHPWEVCEAQVPTEA